MKPIDLLLPLLILFASLTVAGELTEAAAPKQFDKYWTVFLVRPESPKDYGEQRNAELQREHLAHLTWLREEGYALVAGPFGGKPEDDMRGIVLLRVTWKKIAPANSRKWIHA